MTSSLVGSEMCIRDRTFFMRGYLVTQRRAASGWSQMAPTYGLVRRTVFLPVSYTHLTLPTICSV
eukprot:8301008-Prorocentrum_lima.AAC.1